MSEERIDRRLTTVLAADVVGYSRLMAANETGTLAALKALRRELIEPNTAEYGGRVVKLMGDGILMEFGSVVDAVNFAAKVQQAMIERSAGVAADKRICYRVGINIGDIIVEDEDIYGEGVNVAARLEGLAEPGGICVAHNVYEQAKGKVDFEFEDLGTQKVKNIPDSVRIYRVRLDADEALPNDSRPGLNAPPSLPDKPSIVVLPFDNLSNDPDQEYFADGMVEAITAALANIRSFFVIARNSAFTYKDSAFDVRNVGRELGVGYALEGSVQRAGNQVRVTAQLVETVDGAHVWAQKFDGSLDDIFELQYAITEQVAGALQPSIRLAEIERTGRKPPKDFGAYDFTMQALPHCWHLERQETEMALSHLENALAIDPDYPLALSLTAWCHAQRSVYNWTDDVEQAKALALQLAERAASHSGEDPLVLTVLGTAHTIVRNYGAARIMLERAVSIDANAAWAWSRLGWLEAYGDNCDAAIGHFEKSMRLSPFDPLNFNTFVGMASAYEGAGRYYKAIEYFERALDERPQATWVYRQFASSLVGAGQMGRANDAYDNLMAAYPDLTERKIRQAMVFSPEYMDRLVINLKKLGLPD